MEEKKLGRSARRKLARIGKKAGFTRPQESTVKRLLKVRAKEERKRIKREKKGIEAPSNNQRRTRNEQA